MGRVPWRCPGAPTARLRARPWPGRGRCRWRAVRARAWVPTVLQIEMLPAPYFPVARSCRAIFYEATRAPGWEERERYRGHGAEVEAGMGLDRAQVLEGQLGPDQAVAEAARLDLQRLDVAGDLLAVAVVRHLECAGSRLVVVAAHEHHEVRLDRERRLARCDLREVHPCEVDLGGRPCLAPQVDPFDEDGGDDVHGRHGRGCSGHRRDSPAMAH